MKHTTILPTFCSTSGGDGDDDDGASNTRCMISMIK